MYGRKYFRTLSVVRVKTSTDVEVHYYYGTTVYYYLCTKYAEIKLYNIMVHFTE